MIRRSCNHRFEAPIHAEIKETTIRDRPWPIGVPIMLFRWEGKPYRSKQIDIAPVIVTAATAIDISRDEDDIMTFSEIMGLGRPLWQTEGFNSHAELADWFRKLVKPGHTVTKTLMRFRLAKPEEIDRPRWIKVGPGHWMHQRLGQLVYAFRRWDWLPPHAEAAPARNRFATFREAMRWFEINAINP